MPYLSTKACRVFLNCVICFFIIAACLKRLFLLNLNLLLYILILPKFLGVSCVLFVQSGVTVSRFVLEINFSNKMRRFRGLLSQLLLYRTPWAEKVMAPWPINGEMSSILYPMANF